jgi:hypothetical protein
MANIPTRTQSVLDDLPKNLAARLLDLRALILKTASENPAIGPLEETLKWGEPAFLTSARKSGTTIRINRHKKSDDHYAFYVHCQTDLLERYRQLYDGKLAFEGNRAVILNVSEEIPVAAVRHCIAMALTYHLK